MRGGKFPSIQIETYRRGVAHLATVCFCTRQVTRPDLLATAQKKAFSEACELTGYVKQKLEEKRLEAERTASGFTWQAREGLLASADLAAAGD